MVASRLPAYGRDFLARRLAGFDPRMPVALAVDWWPLRERPTDLVLVVPPDFAIGKLDLRLVAGCEVGVVCHSRSIGRAQQVAEIACTLARFTELVVWDTGAAWRVLPGMKLPDWVRQLPGVDEDTWAKVTTPEFVPMFPSARQWWFGECRVAEHGALASRRRAA